MVIHGFAFLKFAKPAHGHHLQVFHTSQAYLTAFYRDFKKASTPNGLKKVITMTNE
jgi:hypothetical protein